MNWHVWDCIPAVEGVRINVVYNMESVAMTGKGFKAAVLSCVLAAMCCFAFSGVAAAQEEDFMKRKGIGGLLSNSNYDASKGATPLQMTLGIGSFFVMIAVVKWL
jgi:hypothetical protein